ncbi:IS3 family transposase [Mycoplasmatota bacterium WC44]
MLCSTDENPFQATRIEKYQIIDGLKHIYPVQRLCRVLLITRRSYYWWLNRGKPLANNINQKDLELFTVEHFNTKEVYGVLRLKYHIQRKYGFIYNHKKIRRYKRLFNLDTITRKRRPLYLRTTKKESHLNMAPNVLDCNFTSDSPYQKLSTDVSYIKCTDGTLYLSAVKDLFNNEIVSYSISNRNDGELVKKTLEQIPKGNGIIHSDQGGLYFSLLYRIKLKELGYTRSMSRRGACWENSPIENWFSQLKEEHLRPIGKKTMKVTKQEIKKYIQWHNHERIQKSLNYLTPVQYLQNV